MFLETFLVMASRAPVALLMLMLGLSSLLGSVLYSSYVAAFIGLGLTFWGARLPRPCQHDIECVRQILEEVASTD
jgi:hypothetical protein